MSLQMTKRYSVPSTTRRKLTSYLMLLLRESIRHSRLLPPTMTTNPNEQRESNPLRKLNTLKSHRGNSEKKHLKEDTARQIKKRTQWGLYSQCSSRWREETM